MAWRWQNSYLDWCRSGARNLHNEAVLADKVQSFREQDPTLMDLSFDTISAAGGKRSHVSLQPAGGGPAWAGSARDEQFQPNN